MFGKIASFINASIGRRLGLGMASMLLAGLAVSTVLFMRDERREMQEILYEKAKTTVTITSSRLATNFQEGDLPGLDEELAPVVEDHDFDYAFVYDDKQILTHAQDEDVKFEPPVDLPAIDSLKPQRNIVRVTDSNMELITPVVVNGRNVAGFGLGVSLDLPSRQAHRLRLRLLLVTLVLVSSALVFIAWWTRRTITPLNELKRGAERIAGGDLSVRVTATGPDEVGSLATTFNQLAESLQRTLEEKDSALRESTRLYRNLKVARARLDRAERLSAVGMLAAGVSHELNNPLSIILSTAGNLRESLGDANSVIVEDVAMIESETQRCRRIIQGLLNFAASGERHLAEVDLNVLLRETFAIAIRDERAHELTVEWGLDANLPPLWVDPLQIQQVFLNLLMNAADAMNGHGQIHIRTAESIEGGRRQVLIEFRDHGCGITPADLDHIFDPFYTTKKGGTGFGLGLAVSYGIIHAHGGEITVQSTLGRGSAFTITLPRRVEQVMDRKALRESRQT
ncbi:MAG: HAMP domain-containing protein [Deltaproteobacteria bacterium]|nr:HAMP domain-containing protein [Deltaproteobacteria bacterium]